MSDPSRCSLVNGHSFVKYNSAEFRENLIRERNGCGQNVLCAAFEIGEASDLIDENDSNGSMHRIKMGHANCSCWLRNSSLHLPRKAGTTSST
jgi:hypothetical protein